MDAAFGSCLPGPVTAKLCEMATCSTEGAFCQKSAPSGLENRACLLAQRTVPSGEMLKDEPCWSQRLVWLAFNLLKKLTSAQMAKPHSFAATGPGREPFMAVSKAFGFLV